MKEDRIGSECWYLSYDDTARKKIWLRGILRAWSTDSEEFDGNGALIFPVGIVENKHTTSCKSVCIQNICFAAMPPQD